MTMNERIKELAGQAGMTDDKFGMFFAKDGHNEDGVDLAKFAELILADMYRKVLASILITDIVMEEKGQKPTSEDYIREINKDFGVE
jgi:hypothetical protein